MSYTQVISYTSAAEFSFDSALVTFTGTSATLVDLGGGTYTTTNPVLTTQHQNMVSNFTGFSEGGSFPAGTVVQYQIVLNGSGYYWWNSTTGKWSASNGTFAQSNTASVINSHASAFFSDLALLTSQYLGLRVFLSTSNAAATPILNFNHIVYTWANSNATAISQCLVTGYLADLVGNNPIPTSAKPVQLSVTAPYGFLHGNHFVEPFTKNFSFDNTGYLSASLIETATPGVKLNFALTVYDGNSILSVPLFSAIVPNQPQVSINNLSSPVPYSFG